MVTDYSDAEILRRLNISEDTFVERKSLGDWKKDALKTAVAFANSCPVDGPPGLLCIGVKDDGTIEGTQANFDSLQKTLERQLAQAFPNVAYSTRVIRAGQGQFLAVIIPGSPKGPHFSGPAYVRTGPTSIKASPEQFERIIDKRDRRVREILKWQHKRIKLRRLWAVPNNSVGRIAGYLDVVLLDCFRHSYDRRG